MDWLVAILGGLAVLGVAVAVYERRRGRTLLRHDLNKQGPQTESDRQAIRATDEVAGRMASGGFPPH